MVERPAAMCRGARDLPLSLLIGAKPARQATSPLRKVPSSGMRASNVAAVAGPTPLRLRIRRFASERIVGLDVSGDLGFERRQCLAQAGDMHLQASHHADVAGVLEPVGLGDQHLLHLIAPSFQVPEGGQLGRWRHVEAQTLGPEAVEGKHASIDRIGLGKQAQILGEVPYARPMGLGTTSPSSTQISSTRLS